MTVEIYSAKDFKKICICSSIEDYQIYKSQNKWCVSIDYFDETAEHDCSDVITLCPASSDEATEDLIVLTKKYGLTEIFSSEAMSNQIYKLASGLIEGLQTTEEGEKQ
jgi:hypothetical protein